MKLSRFVLIILALATALGSAMALTASMGNVRMILYPEVYPGETTVVEKSIQVNNVNDQEIMISLSTQGNFTDIIRIVDTNFTLGANESKNARFQIVLDKPGKYEGKVFVAFNPISQHYNASPVGLASNIIIFAKNSTKPIQNETGVADVNSGEGAVALIILAAILAVGAGVYITRGRK